MNGHEARNWIKEQFGTQSNLAKKAGWQHTKVSKLLGGKQPWTEEDIETVSKLTGASAVTLGRLLRGKGVYTSDGYQYDSIRSWGPEPGNRSTDPETWIDKAVWQLPSYVLYGMGKIEDMSEDSYKVVWVRGHSNAPRINEGDFLIVNTAIKEVSGAGNYLVNMGKYADCRGIEDYKDQDGERRWFLTTHNPDYPDRIVPPESYEILGGVVGHIRPI